jgi:cell division protein FtsA
MATTQQTVVGLDIGSKNIRGIIAQPPSYDRDFPRIISTARTNSDGLRHGYVTSPADLTEALEKLKKQLEKNSGFPVDAAYVTIGSVTLASSRIVSRIDIISPDMIIREQHTQSCINRIEQIFYDATKNKKILHIFPVFWELDHTKVLGNPIGMEGQTLACVATVVHCQEHHYDDLIKSLASAGIQPAGIIATPIAESYPALSKQDRVAGCALVNIGSETISVSVYEDDVLISLAVFPIGSMHITHDIALGLQIPIEEAEDIKTGNYEGPLSKKKLSDIIEARAEDIFELVQNHLKSLTREVVLPGGIIITGGGSMLTGIASMAKQSLGLPVRILKPDHVFKTNKRDIDIAWVPAFGLCFLNTETESVQTKTNFKNIARGATGGFKKFLEQFIP